ncbi:MAG: aminotransferase class I/II-fold pyridoxal phosphate-dependent enzyme, partial [Chthoniobacterales bacterium]
MSIRVADHVRDIPRSGIRDFFEVVQTMNDVVSLGIGEPGFATPWHIREAAIYSLEKGHTGYTSNLGLPRLRKAITDYVQKNFQLSYDPHSEVLVSVGVSEAIDIALRALLNPGDEVIYHEPCYVSYAPSI